MFEKPNPDLDFSQVKKDRVRRVLVLRSGRMWQVEKAVESLMRNIPQAKIEILSQPSARDECAKLPGVVRVIDFPGEKLVLKKCPPELLFKLRRARYDLLVTVCNNQAEKKFENIYRMVFLIQPKCHVFYNPFVDLWKLKPIFVPGPGLMVLLSPLVASVAAGWTLFSPPLQPPDGAGSSTD